MRMLCKITTSLAVVTLISCCIRESASLNVRSSHRVNPYSIGTRNPRISLSVPIQDHQLNAFSFGLENDSELQAQPSFFYNENSTEPGPAWSSVLLPTAQALPVEQTGMTTVEKIRIATVLGAAASAFLALILKSSPGSWRFFLAGGLCAAVSHTIPTPVDVVKVSTKRRQSDNGLKMNAKRRKSNFCFALTANFYHEF